MDSLSRHSERSKSERSDDLRSEESLVELIKVSYDDIGHTLTVWFDDPQKEAIAEEGGDGVILMKSDDGTVVGFEKLNVTYSNPQNLTVALSKFNT